MHPSFQMKLWHVDRDNTGKRKKKAPPEPFSSPPPFLIQTMDLSRWTSISET